MNWNMNYWTLLFLLAAAGLAYQKFAGGHSDDQSKENAAAPKVEAILCPGTNFTIPAATAQQRIALYDSLYASQVQSYAASNCNTLNGGVQFFGIDKCEIQTMANALTTSDSVQAYMTLIPPTGKSGQDTLDIIFKIFSASGSTYYDFTKPCPPCGGGGH